MKHRPDDTRRIDALIAAATDYAGLSVEAVADMIDETDPDVIDNARDLMHQYETEAAAHDRDNEFQ
jgi:hypothetical protein